MAGEARVTTPTRDEEFAEKRFYLDEFHEKTLAFAVAPGALADADLSAFLARTPGCW